MRLPFTSQQFLEVFGRYNEATWPIPLFAYGLAVVGLAALCSRWRNARSLLMISLAAMWAWTGIAYHMVFFSRINGAAWLFGALFVAQASVLVALAFRSDSGTGPTLLARLFGWSMVLYAMIAYPAIGILNGHALPEAPVFGVTPCPLAIFTFGTMLLLFRRIPLALVGIPLLWAVIATSAAIQLGMVEDYGLSVSALVAVGFLLSSRSARTSLRDRYTVAARTS